MNDIIKNIRENTITKTASDGKKDEGIERIDLKQVTITFERLPENAEDIEKTDRSGDNGRFVAVALLIAAYKAWRPDEEDKCQEMMKALMDSPSIPNVYTAFTKSFVKDRMLQNNKWQYIADAYFDGACQGNAYTPGKPLTITLREYPYLPQLSTIYGKELHVEKIISDFKGSDSERSVSVYEDPDDGKWYIWSDTYGSLLADIKEPLK